jgi:hypothetical protein
MKKEIEELTKIILIALACPFGLLPLLAKREGKDEPD